MAKLRVEVQEAIVRALARWERPTEIQAAVRERFSTEVSLPTIAYYDPHNSSTNLSDRWVLLFHEARAAFQKQAGSIGIAHQAFRLSKLDLLLRRAEETKNDKLALEVLALAAKEAGGFYARHPEIEVPAPALSGEQKRAQLRELYWKLTGKLMEEGWQPPATDPRSTLRIRKA